MKKFKDTDMPLLIGRVLRAGVVTSISIVIFGGIVYLYRHGHSLANYREFKGVPGFVQYNAGLFHEAFNLKGQAIIQLGIILLIATPVLRIIFSAAGFALEKDYLYLGISILVLFIILSAPLAATPDRGELHLPPNGVILARCPWKMSDHKYSRYSR